MTDVAAAISTIRERMADACARAGRASGDVRLMLATKTVPPEQLREAFASGEHLYGENRVQELLPKALALAELPIEWHMIGHLQSNKVKQVITMAQCVQSVDRTSLATELNRLCQQANRTINVLVEVNVSGETSKHGCHPNDVDALLDDMAAMPALLVRGFMTIGANTDDERTVRRGFAILRDIAVRARTRGVIAPDATELSMGMSGDMEWAIAEGSTMVRVGSAIFGQRGEG